MIEGFLAPVDDAWWVGVDRLVRVSTVGEVRTSERGVEVQATASLRDDSRDSLNVSVTADRPAWDRLALQPEILFVNVYAPGLRVSSPQEPSVEPATLMAALIPSTYLGFDPLHAAGALEAGEGARLSFEVRHAPWFLDDAAVATVVGPPGEVRLRGSRTRGLPVRLSEPVVWDRADATPWAPEWRTSTALLVPAGPRADSADGVEAVLVPWREPRRNGEILPECLFPGGDVYVVPIADGVDTEGHGDAL